MPHPVVPIFENQMNDRIPSIIQTAVDIAMPKGSIRLLHLHHKERTWELNPSLFIQESHLTNEQPRFAIRMALQVIIWHIFYSQTYYYSINHKHTTSTI